MLLLFVIPSSLELQEIHIWHPSMGFFLSVLERCIYLQNNSLDIYIETELLKEHQRFPPSTMFFFPCLSHFQDHTQFQRLTEIAGGNAQAVMLSLNDPSGLGGKAEPGMAPSFLTLKGRIPSQSCGAYPRTLMWVPNCWESTCPKASPVEMQIHLIPKCLKITS